MVIMYAWILQSRCQQSECPFGWTHAIEAIPVTSATTATGGTELTFWSLWATSKPLYGGVCQVSSQYSGMVSSICSLPLQLQ